MQQYLTTRQRKQQNMIKKWMKTNQRDTTIIITTQQRYKYKPETKTILYLGKWKYTENKLLNEAYNNTYEAGRGLLLRSQGFPCSRDQLSQQLPSRLVPEHPGSTIVTGVECVWQRLIVAVSLLLICFWFISLLRFCALVGPKFIILIT